MYLVEGQSLATKLVVILDYKLTQKINITAYFENLTVELHILYALNTHNTHVNFCVNRMLFTI